MGGWREAWRFRLIVLALLGVSGLSAFWFVGGLLTGTVFVQRGHEAILAADPMLYAAAMFKWAVLPGLMIFILIKARRNGVGWERLKRLWQWGPD